MNRWLVVSLATALAAPTAHAKGDDPQAAITKLLHAQIDAMAPLAGDEGVPEGVYLDGAQLSTVGNGDQGKVGPSQFADAVVGPCYPKQRTIKQLHISPSADGASAAASFLVELQSKCDVSGELFPMGARVSEVVVKTKDGWRIAGGAWSTDEDNARTNEAARAGKLAALQPVGDSSAGDASVGAAFAALLADGVDKDGAARADLIVFGSGPGERTTSGAPFARAWKAAWVGHIATTGPVRTEVAPSGTTAWVTANVKLTKGKAGATYAIPFRLFVVFDRTKAGAWSLIHVHIAAPTI